MTTPALLTRRSRPPKASTAAWTARSASAAAVTLPATAMARPPSWLIWVLTCSAAVVSRSTTATAAPSPASARAIAAPMPIPAPVTRPVFPVKRAYEPAILVLRLPLEFPARPSRSGQLDPAALADTRHRGGSLEEHGLQDDLPRRAAREAGAGLAPGPGAAQAVARDRARGLHRDGVGPLIPGPALAGHHLLPEPGVAERVQRPAEPHAQPQPGVGDREVAAGEVAQVGQDGPGLPGPRDPAQVERVPGGGAGVRPRMPAARGQERAGCLVVGEHAPAACGQQAAAVQERGAERGVMTPHHFQVGGRLVGDRLGQPQYRAIQGELALNPQWHREQPGRQRGPGVTGPGHR